MITLQEGEASLFSYIFYSSKYGFLYLLLCPAGIYALRVHPSHLQQERGARAPNFEVRFAYNWSEVDGLN
jgi:hypothetical protein